MAKSLKLLRKFFKEVKAQNVGEEANEKDGQEVKNKALKDVAADSKKVAEDAAERRVEKETRENDKTENEKNRAVIKKDVLSKHIEYEIEARGEKGFKEEMNQVNQEVYVKDEVNFEKMTGKRDVLAL